MKTRTHFMSGRRRLIAILAFCGLPDLAGAQLPPPIRTSTAGFRTMATVISVEAIHEHIVVGKHCAPMPGSASIHITCMPVTSLKPTAVGYVAEFAGIRFSGVTYRPLAIGENVEVDVTVLINPAE